MKADCPSCSGKKSMSQGPHNGRWWQVCHRCGWKHSEPWSVPLRPGTGSGNPLSTSGQRRSSNPDGEEQPREHHLYWLGLYGVSWTTFQRMGGSIQGGRLRFNCPSFEALRNTSGGPGPKWLTRIRKPLGASPVNDWGWGKGTTLVITEDSMAALKAALAGFHGFPLLGTAVRQLDPGKFRDRRIRVLTDPDDAGRMAGQRVAWVLRSLDVKVISGKEPKEYTLEELQALCS